MDYERPFVKNLESALEHSPALIQVVLGPRQVGKTTGILQILKKRKASGSHYVSADGEIERPSTWILEQWLTAKSQEHCDLLIIDEIQKVQNWSETIKKLWDEQKRDTAKLALKVILLGSSSLEIQKGLHESLAGRSYNHFVSHWDFFESREAFDLSLDDYLTFGGYPASYAFRKKKSEWLHYIRHSLIDPVLGRDILSLARVKSAALFRQCFDLACAYGGQELSYTKLLGQLQEKGNTELVKHYLELFEGAFLIKQLFKYSPKRTISRSSSPKLLPLCPALYSVTRDADLNSEEKGRAFEIMIGSALARQHLNLFYWRSGNFEVDFVITAGKKITGIEVKSSATNSLRGLEKFKEQMKGSEILLITRDNYGDVLKRLESR